MSSQIKKVMQFGLAFIMGSLLITDAAEVHATGVVIPGLLAGARLQVESSQSLKFKDVIPQGTDYSCGSASVATILRYAYGKKSIDGPEVLRGMLAVSNAVEVRKHGFSMLDMQRYVDRLGYEGVGYRVPAKALLGLKMPVIVLLNLHGYEHFVVLKQVVEGYAFLADPRLGNREMPMESFVHDWNGVIFAIVGRKYNPSTPLRRGGRTRVHAIVPLVRQILSTPVGHFGAQPINEF